MSDPKKLLAELATQLDQKERSPDEQLIEAMVRNHELAIRQMAHMHGQAMAQAERSQQVLMAFLERHADRHLVLRSPQAASIDRGFRKSGGDSRPPSASSPSPGWGEDGPPDPLDNEPGVRVLHTVSPKGESDRQEGTSYDELLGESVYAVGGPFPRG